MNVKHEETLRLIGGIAILVLLVGFLVYSFYDYASCRAAGGQYMTREHICVQSPDPRKAN